MITGGSQVLIVLAGIVRTKVLAVVLGPIGIGIASIYQLIIDLSKSITGLGINVSSVKNIAQAAASDDSYKLSKVFFIVKRWTLFTGLLGMILCIVFAKSISKYAFGTADFTNGIIIVSISILLMQIANGRLSLLQGLRKIKDLAKVNFFIAIISLILTIPLYLFLKEDGIVPSFIIIAVVTLTLSFLYTRRVELSKVRLSFNQTFSEGKEMVRLGFFTVASSFLELATMYIVRGFIVQRGSVDEMGQFIAAWSISTTYLSLILTAMGADYFPSISAKAEKSDELRKTFNEQVHISLLIISPVIIGLMTFVNTIVHILYSTAFIQTPVILYWQLAGDFFKVLVWLSMFILLAKGKGLLYFILSLIWSAAYIIGNIIGWKWVGLDITGIAFMIAYIIAAISSFVVIWRFEGITFDKRSLSYIFFYLIVIAASLLAQLYLDKTMAVIVGVSCLIGSVLFSIINLKSLINLKAFLNFRS